MDTETLVNKMKAIYSIFIDYIDTTDVLDDQFNKLIEIFEKQEICNNNEEVQLIFRINNCC